MISASEIAETVLRSGFVTLPKVVGPAEINHLTRALERVDFQPSVRSRAGVYAIRNLLSIVPAVQQLAYSPCIRRAIEPVLGSGAFPVRATLFDKTPGANWKVPWHQDLTIAVRKKIDIPGFGPWTTKAGVFHVQPPISVLENMLAVRIHLDDCGDANAPLRVIPGSHSHGRLTSQQIHRLSAESEVTCSANAGDALLMRPLLLHTSSASRSPAHRRVIHLEFASRHLPAGLPWLSSPL